MSHHNCNSHTQQQQAPSLLSYSPHPLCNTPPPHHRVEGPAAYGLRLRQLRPTRRPGRRRGASPRSADDEKRARDFPRGRVGRLTRWQGLTRRVWDRGPSPRRTSAVVTASRDRALAATRYASTSFPARMTARGRAPSSSGSPWRFAASATACVRETATRGGALL